MPRAWRIFFDHQPPVAKYKDFNGALMTKPKQNIKLFTVLSVLKTENEIAVVEITISSIIWNVLIIWESWLCSVSSLCCRLITALFVKIACYVSEQLRSVALFVNSSFSLKFNLFIGLFSSLNEAVPTGRICNNGQAKVSNGFF